MIVEETKNFHGKFHVMEYLVGFFLYKIPASSFPALVDMLVLKEVRKEATSHPVIGPR